MPELRTMDRTGDTKLIWDAGNPDEVANARRTFNELTGKRYTAYTVRSSGKQGDVIRSFDPDAEKIILVPPMAGG